MIDTKEITAKIETNLEVTADIESLLSVDTELNVTTQVVRPVTKELEVTPIKEKQIIVPDYGVDGFNKVTINEIPDNYIDPIGIIEIAQNGLYDIREYNNANVNVDFGYFLNIDGETLKFSKGATVIGEELILNE